VVVFFPVVIFLRDSWLGSTFLFFCLSTVKVRVIRITHYHQSFLPVLKGLEVSFFSPTFSWFGEVSTVLMSIKNTDEKMIVLQTNSFFGLCEAGSLVGFESILLPLGHTGLLAHFHHRLLVPYLGLSSHTDQRLLVKLEHPQIQWYCIPAITI